MHIAHKEKFRQRGAGEHPAPFCTRTTGCGGLAARIQSYPCAAARNLEDREEQMGVGLQVADWRREQGLGEIADDGLAAEPQVAGWRGPASMVEASVDGVAGVYGSGRR
jgi:hypothetical protein